MNLLDIENGCMAIKQTQNVIPKNVSPVQSLMPPKCTSENKDLLSQDILSASEGNEIQLTQQSVISDLPTNLANDSYVSSLTQEFKKATTSSNENANTISKQDLNNFTLMGFMVKHQMKFEHEEREAARRQQLRREENHRRFQEMILNKFKH